MSSNVVVEKNEEFRQFGKRVSFHNVLHLIVPVALLFLLAIIGGSIGKIPEDVLFLIFILSYFIIIAWIGKFLKIYTSTSAILYIVLIPIIGIFSWVILFHLIGYFSALIYPILFLFLGPIFNRILSKSYYRTNIEKTKELLLSDIQLLEDCFSKTKEFETTLQTEKITREIENAPIRYESGSQIDEYSISNVIKGNGSTYLFFEKPGVIHLIRIRTNKFQSLSLISDASSVFPDADQTAVQLKNLL